MRRKSLVEKNKEKIKSQDTLDNNEKETKTQSELEKELHIRSYSEYRIKDDDSLLNDDEDIESKMIRLIIVKKNGGNILDNINIIKKGINNKDLKVPKIKKGLNILEALYNKRKNKKFFMRLKRHYISKNLKKVGRNFFLKLKKYIKKIYIKKYYTILMQYIISHKGNCNQNKNYFLVTSPMTNKKKFKKLNSKNFEKLN